MFVCPSCFLEQDSKDGFCRDCGTQVVELRYCDSCGVKARGAEDFCRECGTRLPEVEPFAVGGRSGAAKATPSEPPAWLKSSDPAPKQTRRTATKTRTKQDEPEWLRGATRGANDILVPHSSTALAPRPTGTPTTTAAPVVTRSAQTPASTRTSNVQALLGIMLAVLGVALASPSSILFSIVLIVIAMVVGGKSLLHLTAATMQRIVDWAWEDPVLRRRMLDE